MKTLAPAGLLLLGLLALLFFAHRPRQQTTAGTTPSRQARSTAPEPLAASELPPAPSPRPLTSVAPRAIPTISTEEKARRVGKILRDYEAIRSAALRDYGAAGETFPGSSHTLLRQLALLEREQHADLAAVLPPRELEELELRETRAGQRVSLRLGSTAATDVQRRAVFRLQRQFDLRHGAATDATPQAVSARETARRELEEHVRGVLGDALFAKWNARAGANHAASHP